MPNETTRQDKELSAGSVLVDKIHEPLDSLLKAYEARLKPLETMEDRWRNYPDAVIESRQLELYKCLVETLQAIEGHTKQLVGEREKPKHSETSKPQTLYKETIELESNRTEHSLRTRIQKEKQDEPQMIPNSNVPEVDEEWGNKLWDAVRNAQNETTESVKPPLVELDFDQKTLELELRSDNYDGESEKSGRDLKNSP